MNDLKIKEIFRAFWQTASDKIKQAIPFAWPYAREATSFKTQLKTGLSALKKAIDHLSLIIFASTQEEGLLFRAKKEGRELYIVAIYPVVSKEFKLSETIADALDLAKMVFVESDSSRYGADFSKQSQKDLERLRRMLPLSEIEKINREWPFFLKEDALEKNGNPLTQFFTYIERFEAALLQEMQLTEPFISSLIIAAEQRKADLFELENQEEQRNAFVMAKTLEALRALNFAKSEAGLAGYIASSKKALNLHLQAWKQASLTPLNALDQILFPEERLRQEYRQKLLLQRNQQAVEKIEKESRADQPAFIALGMARFIGKESILQQLKEKGWLIHQLTL